MENVENKKKIIYYMLLGKKSEIDIFINIYTLLKIIQLLIILMGF